MKHQWMAIAAIIMGMMPANGWASPDDYQSKLTELDKQLSSMTQEYSMRGYGAQSKTLDERLSDGIVMQASGDHQRASYIFMDILAQDKWKGEPGYQTAQLQLAKSLYENGYYRLSQRYLIDLLRTGRGNERTEGVSLLLQVAQKTGDWAEVNLALADVSDFSQHPAYLYIMGRAQFLQGDYELARKCLEAMRTQDEWQVKAAYLIGVLDTIAGDYPAAMRRFQDVANNTLAFRGSQQVHELAILAQARLYYEQGQWADARNAYQQISENSDYFPTILYEMAWTLVREEQYQQAQQNFELLLVSYPNDPHALETRRLLADIKRELGMYDEAVATYQTLVNEYEPVMNGMQAEAARLDSRKAQLKAHVEAEQYRDVNVVPEQAKGMVQVGSDVNKVEQMLNDLGTSNDNTTDSEALVSEIGVVINSDANIRNLPEFQKYSNTADIIRINALLTGYEFTQEYSGDMPGAQNAVNALKQLPRSNSEREIMASLQSAAREERQGKLHKLKLQSDNMQHRIRVMQGWMDSGKTDSLTESEKQNLNAQILELEKKLGDLKQQQSDIAIKLTNINSTGGMDDNARASFLANVQTLQSQLEAQWQKDQSSRQANGDYQSLIQSDRTILKKLTEFDRKFDEGVQARAQELRTRLKREAEMVNAEKSRFSSMKSDVGETAGDISIRYWQSVYEQVREVVLNADLGMVDIAWLMKDARSKALAATLEERKKEREVLEQDFKQFLKESGQDDE